MKKITIILTILFYSLTIFSQTVENIRTELDGEKINIYYQINDTTKDQTYNVIIHCSVDDKKKIKLKSVTGDVGFVEYGKKEYKIVWDVLAEIDGLETAEFFIELIPIKKNGAKIWVSPGLYSKKWFVGYNAAPIFTQFGLRFGRTSTLWIFGGYVATRFGAGFYRDYTYGGNNIVTPLFSATAGFTARVINYKKFRFDIYYGIGFGMWGGYINEDYSYYNANPSYTLGNNETGIELEYGLMFTYKRIYTTFGVTHKSGYWWDTDAVLGLGLFL